MKSILINPFDRTIKVVDYDGKLKDMYKLIGCDCVDAPIRFENDDTMFVDDDGLYDSDNSKGSIIMKGWNYPIVGKVLVCGCNEEGESVDVKTPIEFFEREIKWVDELATTRWMNQFN